jgi:hypothetical protein
MSGSDREGAQELRQPGAARPARASTGSAREPRSSRKRLPAASPRQQKKYGEGRARTRSIAHSSLETAST